MVIMTHAKFYLNRLMLSLIFGIRAWQTIEKVGSDKVKALSNKSNLYFYILHAVPL